MGAENPSKTIEQWRNGTTATIVLNRPKVHNALNRELIASLRDQLEALDHDAGVRAIILTGAGASFCSGDDLQMLRDSDFEQFRKSIIELQSLTSCLLRLSKPVVCVMNGPAFGAGLELSLACDIRLATPDFQCATPEIRLGLVVTNAASVLLPYAVGAGQARRMLYTGEKKDAAWCLNAGLVDSLHDQENLMNEARRITDEIAKGSPVAIAATRRLVNGPLVSVVEKALRDEVTECVISRETADGQEGLTAYFEKRAPVWRGE